MMSVNFIVIRHGESIGNVAKRLSEQGDHSLIEKLRGTHTAHWPLTKKGVEQAKSAGLFLDHLLKDQSMSFNKMYVSAYARAMETAANLETSPSEWIVDARLSERDWGELDRMTEEERQEKFSYELKMRNVEPFFWAPPNGESFKDLIIRIRDFVDSIIRADVENALVVCHGEVMKAFRIIFLQLTPEEYAKMEFSTESHDRIHNCQVDWYTRKLERTDTTEPSKRLEWLKVYRPTSGSESEVFRLPLPRKRYDNLELYEMAKRLSLQFKDFDV